MRAHPFVFALLCSAVFSQALEIPLERSASSKKGAVVAFVDMERVYQQFPETLKAKQEYKEQLEKLKRDLSEKEASLEDLRQQLEVLTAAQSSEDGAALQANTSQKQQDLAAQETSLDDARARAVEALGAFEKKRTAQIFGKLYKSLVQLADEKGVDIVVDKASLLYGQAALDLTETLSRRVRGLPEPEQ